MASQAELKLPFPKGSVNEELFNALVRHQVYLMRLSKGVRMKIAALLDATEADIAEKIKARLSGVKVGLQSPGDARRLQTLLRIVRNIRVKAWEKVDEVWVKELVDIAKAEAVSFDATVKTVVPVQLTTVLPPARTLKALVTSNPFEGRTLRDWAKSIQAEDLRRIEGAIRVGVLQGQTTQQIASRVVGSARLAGVDGVTEITRRNAEAITRTAINHVANAARAEVMNENSDLFEEELFVATLDARTTAVCMSNDGKKFKRGTGPRPPLHFNCRSLRVPVILPDSLGERPAKASTEQGLLREFAEKRKLDRVTKRADLPHGTKGAFDDFARKRVRELTGRVPGSTSYQQWLEKQSAAFQDDVLGKTKGKLFRKGGLKLDKFVNKNGDELSLRELAKRERAAFKAAGLDPDDFL